MNGPVSLDQAFLQRLVGLPNKIVRHHDVHALPEIVLHDVAHADGLNLSRALYLVDNPDFNCIKGVAGFCKDECSLHKQNIWDDPNSFSSDMQQAKFCSDARGVCGRSFVKCTDHNRQIATDGGVDHDEIVNLGRKLGMQNPSFVSWPMRHGNHGILLFEAGTGNQEKMCDQVLEHCGSLLSLC